MQSAATARVVLVVQEGPGNVVVFSSANPDHRHTISVGKKPHEIVASPDGNTAYVSNFGLLEVNYQVGIPGTTISVLDIQGGVERARYELPPGGTAPHGLKLRPPQYRELFTHTEVGREQMVIFDAESGVVLRKFDIPAGVHNFLFHEEGRFLYAFSTRGAVMRISAESGEVSARIELAAIRGLAWTADQRHLIAGGNNELVLLNPIDLAVERRWGDLGIGQVFYPAATSDGQWILAPAVLDGIVLAIDPATGKVAHRIETGSPLQIALDGEDAWVANVLVPPELLPPDARPRSGGVTRLNLRTFQTVPISGIPDANGIVVAGPRGQSPDETEIQGSLPVE